MSMQGNCGSRRQGSSFIQHLREFTGRTVTIFTTSGGVSGCGFTGVILGVNSCFVRLVTDMGEPPTNPLADNICPDMDNASRNGLGGLSVGKGGKGGGNGHMHQVGSVVDIPIERIAAFCHNAI